MKTFFATALSIFFFFLIFEACDSSSNKNISQKENYQDPLYINIPDDSAGRIIKECIIQSGGLESWQNKKALSYTKIVHQYDSLGNPDRVVTEYHTYQFSPYKARMEWREIWTENKENIVLVFDGDTARKFVNGIQDTSARGTKQALLKTHGPHYVLSMPYKLAEPDVKLTYEGEKTVFGKKTFAVKASYPEADSLSAAYPWTYYFDINTKQLIANSIPDSGNDLILSEYELFDSFDGVQLATRRVIYLSDTNYNILYKGNEVLNTQIRFMENPVDSIFEF